MKIKSNLENFDVMRLSIGTGFHSILLSLQLRRLISGIVLGGLWGFASTANANKAPEPEISIWSRVPGNYTDGATRDKNKKKILNLESMPSQGLKTFDIQYEKEMTYRGLYLKAIFATRRPPNGKTLALLHFENGMIIPIDTAKKGKNGRNYSVFIALEYKRNGKWQKNFPNMAKVDNVRYYSDPNPTRFLGNKAVVVTKKANFYQKNNKSRVEKRFTPWRHVNALVGIEYVNEGAYYNQFRTKAARKFPSGFKVFKERCQYCHGVRMVGASFGWDYVDPIKLSKKRDPKSLHLFVKYPKVDAFFQGTKMPIQKDFTEQETKSLWNWINSVAKSKLNSYQP